MYYKCCIQNCSSKRLQVKLHQLPTSEKGLHKWLLCLNSDRLHNLSPRDRKNEFVCHKHFESRFVKDNGRILLEGYPSLFSPEEIESGVPSATLEAKLVSSVKFDHCYGQSRKHEDHTYAKPKSSKPTGKSLEQPTTVGQKQDPQIPPDQPYLTAARDSARAVARDHACTKRFHADHTYVKIKDRDKLILSGIPGKTSAEVQRIEVRLQDSTHKDHTYDAKDKPISLPFSNQTFEKCIDVDPDANDPAQIDVPPDIEPVPEVEETFDPDYEVQVSPSPLPEVEGSGCEAVFSWQRDEELIEADELPAPAPSPPADPTLALYCDSDDPTDPDDPKDPGDPDPDIVFDPQPDQAVPSVPAPVDNRCKDCKEVNTGFDFWCVQCAGGALCGGCAGRAPHHAHYVLRAPMGCSRARTQEVLTMIRQQAVLIAISQQLDNQHLSQLGTVDDELKLEVKEEPLEPPAASCAAAERDPLACEPREQGDIEPELVHELIEPQEPVSLRPSRSPTSLPSRPDSPHSSTSLPSRSDSPHSSTSLPSRPNSPHAPASPHEPAVTPEPATLEADESIAEIIVEQHELLQPPRLRKPAVEPEEILPNPTQRKLVKVSPAEVKRAFLSHIERVTTQNKQLKVYQPRVKLTQDRENVVATDKGPTYEHRTTPLQVRRTQAPLKVTSEPKPSETVTIDLDAADETVEYLEEGFESDIEMVDNVDNHEDYLEENDLSDEERIVSNRPGRGVKRKKDANATLPVKGPSEAMARALPSKAVIEMRPLTSLEIRNWTADRKRLRND